LFFKTRDISISLRHLKRDINQMGLYRTLPGSHSELKLLGSSMVIDGWIVSLDSFFKRNMWQLSSKHWTRLVSPCSGKGNYLKRREYISRGPNYVWQGIYISRGPNYVWHLDSYMDVKSFGICISGCIYGFSRHIILMEAGKRNVKRPKFNGGYFCRFKHVVYHAYYGETWGQKTDLLL